MSYEFAFFDSYDIKVTGTERIYEKWPKTINLEYPRPRDQIKHGDIVTIKWRDLEDECWEKLP